MKSFYTTAVQDYYLDKFRRNATARRNRLASLKSKEDALAYQAEVRKKISSAFNLPQEKSPLHCTVVGSIETENYRIDKLIYESRPGIKISANLYVPHGVAQAPGVLFLAGHSPLGKACDVYQRGMVNLALNGYVVLAPDPSGQSERKLYYDTLAAADFGDHSTWDHNMAARQLELVGESYSSWCLWDAVRSLDCLLECPQVDPTRISVTGNSGGGNMGAFLTAVDARLHTAAPSCYLTTWEHNIENELPCCAEQEPPLLPGLGCEMGDLLIAYAPRPTLVLGQEDDFFDARGTAETFEEVKRFYRLLDAENNIELFIGPHAHGYHVESRHAMYDFFNRHNNLAKPIPESEPMPLLSAAELSCTPTGQTGDLPGARHIVELAQDKEMTLSKIRAERPLAERLQILSERLGLDRVEVPFCRNLRTRREINRPFSRFGLETEGDGRLMAVLKIPAFDSCRFHLPVNLERVVLHVAHADSLDEIPDEILCDKHQRTCLLDVRGVGELTPGTCDHEYINNPEIHPWLPPQFNRLDQYGRNRFAWYNYDYHYSACGWMLGDSYMAGRIRDVLGTLKLLQSLGTRQIDIEARGQGTIPAVLAAIFFQGAIGKVTLHGALKSYSSLLERKETIWPISSMIPGILELIDLPEIYQTLQADITNTL